MDPYLLMNVDDYELVLITKLFQNILHFAQHSFTSEGSYGVDFIIPLSFGGVDK